jgi:hypothetical protein
VGGGGGGGGLDTLYSIAKSSALSQLHLLMFAPPGGWGPDTQGVSSVDKRFKRFPRANHNNLYRSQPHEFTKELEHFMDLVFKPVDPSTQVRPAHSLWKARLKSMELGTPLHPAMLRMIYCQCDVYNVSAIRQ